jgi:hypothetical protein
MATKPTETLAFEPTGTAVVTIPTGKQAAGFRPGERPPAQYLNWLFRTLSRLYNYVVDGQFTGNHSIAGTLTVTGNFTAADLRHGQRVLDVMPGAFVLNEYASAGIWSGGTGIGLQSTEGGGICSAGISIPKGCRVISVKIWFNRNGNTTGGTIFELRAMQINTGSVTSSVLATATVTDVSADVTYRSVTITPSAPGYTIPTTHALELRISQVNVAGAAVSVLGAEVTYDRP